MRKSDKKLSLDDAAAIQTRLIETWAGLIVVIAGCALALLRPESEYLGIGAALIGAGVLDAKTLLSIIKK